MDREFHNKIAEKCLLHFRALPKTGKPKDGEEWTVLSCIAKRCDDDDDNLEVVSVGTGSKCIGKSKMCPRGTVLNDSHAEIVCRRSFLRYLYDQMNSERSIFDFSSERSRFQLKAGVTFHFFTTHVPCGDAAIFATQLVEDFGDILTSNEGPGPAKKKKIASDVSRTGAKCVVGDVRQDSKEAGAGYHVVGVVRTKPGRGDPTLSASCSDKMAKWCHLGIQGALLSILLESPIYLSSFTIATGTPFCPAALERALHERLGGAAPDDVPYHPIAVGWGNKPFPHAKTDSKRPCASSISWSRIGNNEQRALEVAVDGRRQGVTKKNSTESGGALKICKLALFGQFIAVAKRFEIKIAADVESLDVMTYEKAKRAAEEYQRRWHTLRQLFNIWPRKDDELLQFCAPK
ncbi:tRNA-specific adenosine deaminase 1 [Cylas formicarius]|uniref:tRNA-specific adenosine deaminase 1 n=1 Tax=Cylas formicarius TaxID=197179 RepID=UPI0029586F86|nr:tRNA-specific adenosine deaminase 1 [Cylas formicarius]